MDNFIKLIAGVLITAIIYLILSKRDKEITVLLTLAVCCMIVGIAVVYMRPLFDFFNDLRKAADLNSDFLKILLQAVGIGLLSEITSLICTDIGNAAMGKTIQIVSSSLILYISLPLFQKLMTMISEIMGEI